MTTGTDSKERFTPSPLFSRTLLRVLFFVSISIAAAIFCIVLARPQIVESSTVRYMICLFLSLCLAIAFFVFWPARLEMERVPIINLPVRVTGPVVLWFIVFTLFLNTMPREERFARIYKAVSNGREYLFMYDRNTKLDRNDGSPLVYQLVPNRDRLGELFGIYVEFKPGEQSIPARLTHYGHDPLDVVFERDKTTFDVSSLKKIGAAQ